MLEEFIVKSFHFILLFQLINKHFLVAASPAGSPAGSIQRSGGPRPGLEVEAVGAFN